MECSMYDCKMFNGLGRNVQPSAHKCSIRLQSYTLFSASPSLQSLIRAEPGRKAGHARRRRAVQQTGTSGRAIHASIGRRFAHPSHFGSRIRKQTVHASARPRFALPSGTVRASPVPRLGDTLSALSLYIIEERTWGKAREQERDTRRKRKETRHKSGRNTT